MRRTEGKDFLAVTASLIEVTLNSIIRKLPFALPSVPVTVGGALLLALGLGFAWAAPLQRALAAMLDITPGHFRFTVFYALFALWFYLPVSMMFPTIAPAEGRLRFLARLPLPPRMLGICLMSPVLLVLVLLVLMVLPAYLGAAAAALGLSYLNALLMLVALAAVCATHAQATYALGANLAVRWNALGLSATATNQILAFGYAALLVFAVRQSFLGVYSSYGQLVKYILVLLKWPLLLAPAGSGSPWLPAAAGAVLLAAGALGTALLPAVLAPRVNEGFGRARFGSRLLLRFPRLELFVRFARSPRMREHINVYTLALIIITALIKISEQVFQRALSTQLVFLLAAIAGNLAALCSAVTTAPAEFYQFQVGLSVHKMRALAFAFGIVFSLGFGLAAGAAALAVLNQPWRLLYRLLTLSAVSSLVGYAYGALALSRSYYRTPVDGLALIACSIFLLAIGAVAARLGFPLDTARGGAAVGVALAAALAAVFALQHRRAKAGKAFGDRQGEVKS